MTLLISYWNIKGLGGVISYIHKYGNLKAFIAFFFIHIFKEVQLYYESGDSIRVFAANHELCPKSLCRWLNNFKQEGEKGLYYKSEKTYDKIVRGEGYVLKKSVVARAEIRPGKKAESYRI